MSANSETVNGVPIQPPAGLQPNPNEPKQEAGMRKVPFQFLPMAVLAEMAVAHGEGAIKYGPFNWREGRVVATTYYGAAMRHLAAFVEGEDIDPDSGLSHLTKAITSLAVLRDAQIQGTAIDDRPRPSPPDLMARLNQATETMRAKQSAQKGI
ncbi:hypothetical protein J7443_17650 [Tropicibacter sp. R15_0]|uniref:dATP/dGTP diphosphohydrolase domain-containing protein n=1 Tax=Tropicibacter sp. R15_0 TaxID=2821101 RepID=UPI001AD9A0E2|nr:dATP/dGTP diphosphohydrolase domain-containing protein [Tropicibacter sp. R15_0]MBO9467073.1 hypothetical protein [Tropicibacter sp. R15_0]